MDDERLDELVVVVFVLLLVGGLEEEDARADEEEDTYPPNPKILRGLFSGMGGGVSSPARANKVKIKRQLI